jgi:dihydropteroate synthase
MGILNTTPDSFYDGGVLETPEAVLRQAEQMLSEGASILDIGGASSRPGSVVVELKEELRRTIPAIEIILKHFPGTLISIDTWRAQVAAEALAAGASIVNDISAGRLDPTLLPSIGKQALQNVPYVLMHMQGTPQNMQKNPEYEDIVTEVLDFFITQLNNLRTLGVREVVLDPGFGFGKTVAHNYQLLKQISMFEQITGCPVLAGISRKSMICKVLNVKPKDALNGTTAVHMLALRQGARILRVHDVKEAMEVVKIWEQWHLVD